MNDFLHYLLVTFVILAALTLIALILYLIYEIFFVSFINKQVNKKIEANYPNYVALYHDAIKYCEANSKYYCENVDPYKNQIDQLTQKMKYFPKAEYNRALDKLEELKQIYYDNNNNYSIRVKIEREKLDMVETMRKQHSILRHYNG